MAKIRSVSLEGHLLFAIVLDCLELWAVPSVEKTVGFCQENANAVPKLCFFCRSFLLFFLKVDILGQFHDDDREENDSECPHVLNGLEKVSGSLFNCV